LAAMAVGLRYPVDQVPGLRRPDIGVLRSVLEEGVVSGDAGLKTHLSGRTDVGPILVEHCLEKAQLAKKMRCSQLLEPGSAGSLEKLVAALGDSCDMLERLETGPHDDCKGYIVLKTEAETGPDGEVLEREFDDVLPTLLAQHEGREVRQFASFDEALDQFFSKVDSERFAAATVKSTKSALSKLDKVRIDHAKRIGALQNVQDSSSEKALLLETNAHEVQAAIDAVASLVATGMDWSEVANVVKEEHKKGNPVAQLIHQLTLNKVCKLQFCLLMQVVLRRRADHTNAYGLPQNHMILLLSHNLDNANEEDLSKPATKVDVDLSVSALGNAGVYYTAKKKSAVKLVTHNALTVSRYAMTTCTVADPTLRVQAKTSAATNHALKAAGKKSDKEMTQVDKATGQGVQHTRKVSAYIYALHTALVAPASLLAALALLISCCRLRTR